MTTPDDDHLVSALHEHARGEHRQSPFADEDKPIEGKDVFLDLPIAPWKAALGATVKAPTPAGPVDLKIPGKHLGV